ncbi:hypothetical protein ABFS82_03G002900 [Erythranthe guttata]
MAEAFLTTVLEKLSTLIYDEYVRITGVGKEMKKLSDTLTTIQAVVEDAEMKQIESKAIQNWLLKLNDLIYEIDDILDEYATKISKLKHNNSKIGLFNLKNIIFRRETGRRIQQVIEQLDAVAAERTKFHLREIAIERPVEAAAVRETGSRLNESHKVYGRGKDAEKIIDILVNCVGDSEELSILPIIGVGGLGKTTFAQLVYNDQRVVDHFDKRIWVCVSDNFDVKALLKAMIESWTRNASDLANLDALQHRLWELLNNKRYLLVLDDVWNDDQEKWSQLKNVVSCGSKGSSIIVTTRLKKVADIMRTLPSHYLTGLSKEHCWMLIQERAFGQEKEKFPNLEAIGRQIANKCAGVPLAAKALGGLLRFKRTEKQWIYVKESEIWELPHEETLILPALRLSYHHLPLALRQCFAYCATFPKDTFIRKEELIFMWMAHGYISSRGALEVEDVGNDICNELVLRSLLQHVPNRVTKKPDLIMHDLLHDLAQSIMENKIPGTHVPRTANVVTSASNSKIRQVNLRKKFVAFPTSNQPEMDMSFILSNFFRLRILDASKTGTDELFSAVGNLKHLRHLNLSHTGIRTLPDSLCSLWNLHVLNLDSCKKLEALPKKMRYLTNLRHLFLDDCKSLREMPSKTRELSCLRTLSLFIVGYNNGTRLEELQWLKLGGRLKINYLDRVKDPADAKKANLAEKENLGCLCLNWGSDDSYVPKAREEDIDIHEKVLEALEPHPNLESLVICGFGGRCFPFWMSNSTLERVVEIRISDCVNCSHLPQLGELPHLKTLTLLNVARVEYIIEEEVVQSLNPLISAQHFPSLETLYLRFLHNIKGLIKEQVMTRSTEAFPNLEHLYIEDCSSLKLPQFSTCFKKLKRLNCRKLLVASLSKSDLETLTHLVVDFEENSTVATSITVEMLQSLTNLKMLAIYKADTEELSLPEQGLRHLTALETLEIFECPQLVELPDGIKHLDNCLNRVHLRDLPKMVSLPKALQRLSSSLRFLRLSGLAELNSLPDWLGDLTSLEELYIEECPKIASLPASIGGMKNLRFLIVKKCPELERRCERAKGQDWHKISHIPNLYIAEQL